MMSVPSPPQAHMASPPRVGSGTPPPPPPPPPMGSSPQANSPFRMDSPAPHIDIHQDLFPE